MKIKQVLIIFIFLGYLCGAQAKKIIDVEIHPEIEYQTIHNFGASDAWSAQFVGQWPKAKKEQIADLLFSQETNKDGSSKGIGLSAWRFNIGGGSAEQQLNSNIKDEWRRAEGVLNDDGSYNWKKQSGQQWFLRAAKQRGVNCFIGFVNSPPVQLTKNKKAYSSDGLSSNLTEDKYKDYALFLKDVVTHFKDSLQIDFSYISPFNEPQWEWKDAGQEGTPWNNNELAKATCVIDSVFVSNKIQAKIEVTEAGSINYLTSKVKKYSHRSNQIETFFNPNSDHYLGHLKSVAPKIAGHSYFSTYPIEKLKKEREKIAKKTGFYPGLEYWMTEYCVLENNEEIKGGGKDLGIRTALYVARVIHADLTIANASAWHWWLAMSPYNYKDGLIYHDKNKVDGSISTSKLLWALGNYSKFIRPNAKRIKVAYKNYGSIENLKSGVLISAYKNTNGSSVVVVINQKEKDVYLNFKKLSKTIPKEIITTSETSNLISKKITNNEIKINKRSVNTILF